MLTFGAGWCNIHLFAEMAELADAHGSGPCGSDTMRVQVPLSALQGGDHKITAFFFQIFLSPCFWDCFSNYLKNSVDIYNKIL